VVFGFQKMSLWSCIRELPTPEVGENEGIRLWLVESRKSDAVADFAAFLSPDEQRRAIRFNLEIHRQRFTVTRSALRLILGKELACLPEEIQLIYSETGRPEIKRPATTLKFNVSHSGPITLIALSDSAPVGIDVEYHNRGIDLLSVSRTVFCPQELRQLEKYTDLEQIKLFFQLWTAKEAVLKMLGMGFSASLDGFCILDGLLGGKPIKAPATTLVKGEPEWIRVRQLTIGNSYYAALATGVDF